MKTILIFVPSRLYKEKPGQLFGKIVNDEKNAVKKFYIIGRQTSVSIKNKTDILGYYSGTSVKNERIDKKCTDYINLYTKPTKDKNENYDYCLESIFINSKNISLTTCHVMIIIYDQLSLLQSELFVSFTSNDHFVELKELLKRKTIQNEIKRKTWFDYTKEFVLTNLALLLFYPVLFLCTISKFLLPISKISTLFLHWNGWLENFNWLLNSIIQEKKITTKTGNYISTIIVDILLGIFMLRFILFSIEDEEPSEILLSNADVSFY